MSETTDIEEHFLELMDLALEQGLIGIDEDPPDQIGATMLTPSPNRRPIEEGEIFWSRTLTNSDGTPLRARRSGQLKTWKTRPGQYRLPVKYGLKTGTYITEANASDWCHSIDQ